MNKDIFVAIEHLRDEVANISYMMLAAARMLANHTGGEVVALLFGYQQEHLAEDLEADSVWYTDHPALADFGPDTYLDLLEYQIQGAAPRALLFGHSSIGMELDSSLSARLELPLVSQCRDLVLKADSAKFVCQICGGKMMAEGYLPEPTALITMVPGDLSPELGRSTKAPQVYRQTVPEFGESRFTVRQYVEPDTADIDITKEDFLVAVGRGLQNRDDLELVEQLATTLGAAVCASRPIVDQGWLPTSRLIGKSGRIVKPKIYLALGISGAPEHVEGITGSDLIIAINTDPRAPIFEVAHLGADVDMLDLVDELNNQLELAPVG